MMDGVFKLVFKSWSHLHLVHLATMKDYSNEEKKKNLQHLDLAVGYTLIPRFMSFIRLEILFAHLYTRKPKGNTPRQLM